MTKLTLSADKEIIELAREQALLDGTSISAMFSGFIHARARLKNEKSIRLGPLARQAMGIGRKASKVTTGFSDRALLEKALTEKYGMKS
jgi:hypothetical protein